MPLSRNTFITQLLSSDKTSKVCKSHLACAVALFTITLGMAFLLIIITIFVMRLYDKPKRSIAPNWMHSFERKFRKIKLKLKCNTRRVSPPEQQNDIEDVRQIEETDRVKKSTPLKPYSNKELAEFFDYFLFVAYTVLYIMLLSSVPILAKVRYDKATRK
ncbi:Hypothetical predicted protein [Mytilus galloprovincialis]|uniref:Uncharacterized protein n=1 Tax=Mytilus galloprovincialis TaxID=29158 RepID=A0A8B6FC87_MYTGA|nr:Hypothetical predicted protein [Mytilus galloprovincialis]